MKHKVNFDFLEQLFQLFNIILCNFCSLVLLLLKKKVTLNDYLATKGIAQIYIDEIASVATRANYGQDTTNISAFAGLITLVALSKRNK